MSTTAIDPHGRTARHPTDVPARGWKDVLARVRVESKRDNVTLLSAGVAFYSLLALVPAMIAGLSIYGLIADPEKIQGQVIRALATSPAEVRDLVASQLESIAKSSGGAALLATSVGIIVALWSASSGVGNLITAINVAYDEEETRGFVKLKLLALAFTFGAIIFLSVAFTVIALLPSILADTGLGVAGRVIAGTLRWVVLLAGMVVALGVLYRYAPDRQDAKWRWVTPGALVASLLWVAGSAGFSLYTANFAKYNETYGSLGAIVVVMLWLFLTAASVLIGAELNAELERQTLRDTTSGPPQPLGSRGAYAADTVGETAEEVAAEKRAGVSQGGGKPPPEPPAELQPLPADVDAVTSNGSNGASTARSGSHSAGAIPAMVGLSAMGVAMDALRKLLERGKGARSAH